MSSHEWHEAEVSAWLLEHDGGNGECWVCKRPFKIGESVMYESPNYPRKYTHKISRHKACSA